jgi:rod shape-determining protein MreC
MRTLLRTFFVVVFILLVEFSTLFFPFETFPRFISSIFKQSDNRSAPEIPWIQREVDYARLRSLENENTELRDQLAFSARTEYQQLGVRRIGRSTDPFHSWIILDRGARNGVVKGDPVIAGDGILVGTVYSVEPTRSYILPLTDPRSKILASILQEKEEIRGIAEGQFSIGLNMTLIPISAELKEDDLVVTSGLQDRIPDGLVIGTIQRIQKNPEDLFQSAILRVPRLADELVLMAILIRN